MLVDEVGRWRREWCRAGGTIKFAHVKREWNTWADWIGRVAARWERDITLNEISDVWPDDGTAPKEVGSLILKSDKVDT